MYYSVIDDGQGREIQLSSLSAREESSLKECPAYIPAIIGARNREGVTDEDISLKECPAYVATDREGVAGDYMKPCDLQCTVHVTV